MARRQDIEIGVQVDYDSGQLLKVARDLAKVERATQKADAAAVGLSSGLAQTHSTMGDVNRAGQAVGGRFGEMAGRLDALKGALNSTAGRATLLVGAITAVATAGAMAVANIDELNKTLRQTDRERLAPLIGRAEDGSAALISIQESGAALAVVLGASTAPALEGLATILEGVVAIAIPTARLLMKVAEGMSPMLQMLSMVGIAFSDSESEAENMWRTLDGSIFTVEELTREYVKFREEQEKARGSTFTVEELTRAWMDSGKQIKQTKDELKDYEGTLLTVAELTKVWMADQENLAEIARTGTTIQVSELEAMFGSLNENTTTIKDNANALFGAVGEGVSTLGGLVTQAIEQGGSGSKKAMRDAAKASKAFAAMDVGVKTAQSIMSAMTIPPPAGPILAGINAATGAMQLAAVLAQPLPSFHTGGRRGADEQMAPPAIIRRGEVPAIITEQGFRNIGGDRGLAAINRGDTGSGMQPIYLVLEGVTAPLRELARPEPALGQT